MYQFFSYYFCVMTEGSGSLTNGSGSGRPKNIWIRIRNTALEGTPLYLLAAKFVSILRYYAFNEVPGTGFAKTTVIRNTN
jgi:hypothetical protein